MCPGLYSKNEKSRGTPILINSHNLSKLEKVCDRYGFINKGITVGQGALDELKEKFTEPSFWKN